MAHKKGAGSTKNGRDSNAQRLGVKKTGNEIAKSGQIILRQRGYRFKADKNVGVGRDFTLYALKDGKVQFSQRTKNEVQVSIVLNTWESLLFNIGYNSWLEFSDLCSE